MKGYFNRLMRIDLTRRTFTTEPLSDELLKKNLGGKGLGAWFLNQENPRGVDPLDPENLFIIATGPVTGTSMWGQARFGVFTKSPLTGGYGESYCGGTLPPKIKGCGLDAIILRGKCTDLSFLVVDEEGVKFRDATPVKGADCYQAEEYLLQNSPAKASAMVIGPAGENRVAIACIKSDKWRSLGRGGMGAVLGAKNVKGIAFSGGKKAPIANRELLGDLVRRITRQGKDSPVTGIYQNLGTPMQVKVLNEHKCFPTRYWKSGYFPQWKKISADYMQENFEVKSTACPNCFLRCTKHSRVKSGRHRGLELDGPEFETIYALGGLNAIDSLEEIAWLNDICDRYGIDTMSAGNISAFAIEAHKAGRLDFSIDYNQPEKVAELFRLISFRRGVGEWFADGIRSASRKIGMEAAAVHVKGMEPGGFDPRVLKGMGLSYATSARGACHLRGTFYKAELSGQIPKDQIEGKARLHVDYEDRAAIFDSLILCRFFRDFILWDELIQLIEATTGIRYTKGELENLANYITRLTRDYNTREGIGDDQDTLPAPFLREPNAEGATLSPEELAVMLREYNQIRRSDR